MAATAGRWAAAESTRPRRPGGGRTRGPLLLDLPGELPVAIGHLGAAPGAPDRSASAKAASRRAYDGPCSVSRRSLPRPDGGHPGRRARLGLGRQTATSTDGEGHTWPQGGVQQHYPRPVGSAKVGATLCSPEIAASRANRPSPRAAIVASASPSRPAGGPSGPVDLVQGQRHAVGAPPVGGRARVVRAPAGRGPPYRRGRATRASAIDSAWPPRSERASAGSTRRGGRR